jgi:8-oxo-dGTP pyrophosphatase MutT (NUDIX family)
MHGHCAAEIMAMHFESLRRSFEPAIRRLLHFYWRFARGMTLGVRGLVVDGTGRVFLIKHSYIAGWHLPGGGVEPGETLMTALTRELREEGNIELSEQPSLFAMYFNRRASRRDHVALYVVRAFHQSAPPKPNSEIVAHGFFAPDSLPEDTALATRARIAEVLHGRAIAERW